MTSPLLDLIDQAPAQRPALRYAGAEWSCGELAAESARVAAGLRGLGVEEGDRVAVWLPNIPAWLAAFFACARLGAMTVSVNTRFRAHEVADIVQRAGASVLIFWPDFHGIDFRSILEQVDDVALRGVRAIVAYGDNPDGEAGVLRGIPVTPYASWRVLAPLEQTAGNAQSRCVIFTTSGTTRAPKFVCHVQGTVARHARDVATALELTRADVRVLQALPMCGVFGFTQALSALAGGALMDLMPVFDAVQAAQLIREEAITHMHGVDEMLAQLLALDDRPRPFPSLQLVGYAAFNPALDDIAERAEARGLKLCGLYGMSECHALFAIQPRSLPVGERRNGGGRPVAAAARVRIRDADTGAILGPGKTGEIELCGPSVMHEYFGNPEATAEAFTADGFLRTGDLGFIEPDGRFRYLARMGDVLRLGGFLVSPLEIEAVLDEHEAIAASQVVAVTVNGKLSPVAFVIAAPDAIVDAAAITTWCRRRLAGYKVPARVIQLESFPTTASANGTKIQKSRLRAMAETAVSAQSA